MAIFFFYGFALVTVVSAVLVIALRNPLSSAFALIVTFFGVACLFALLQAHFLAAMQILVYAGAIMVLFVFVVMMLDLGHETLKKGKMTFSSTVGILFGGYLGVLLVMRLGFLSEPFSPFVDPGYGTIREVGRSLFGSYLIPFEVTSILLLVAIVGAVVLAKKPPPLPVPHPEKGGEGG